MGLVPEVNERTLRGNERFCTVVGFFTLCRYRRPPLAATTPPV